MEKNGDMLLIEKTEIKNNNQYYKVKCSVCGKEREVSIKNLVKSGNAHSWSTCRESYIKTIKKDYGDYELIGVSDDNKAILKCKYCNNIIKVYESKLNIKKHSIQVCKESYYVNEIGKTYNGFNIISFDRKGCVTYVNLLCVECNTVRRIKYVDFLNKTQSHSNCFYYIEESEVKKAIQNRWHNINQRTKNENDNNFAHYGKRGISNEFKDIVDFYYTYKDELEKDLTLTFDRIDVNENYKKENIRLITHKEQQSNKRETKYFYAFKNDVIIISNNTMEFGRIHNVNGRSVGNCLRGKSKTASGWSFKLITKEQFEKQLRNVTTNSVIVVKQIAGEG